MTDAGSHSEKARIALRDAGFSVSEMKLDPNGRAHHVYRATTDSGTLYVKVSGSPRPRFATEVAALRALASSDLACPELVAFDDEFVITRSLGDDLRPIGADDLNAWEGFGQWLSGLHNLAPDGLGLRYDTDPLSLGERLTTTLRRHASVLVEFSDLVDEVIRDLADLPPARGFVHRDLRADNVLVTSAGEFAGVVDFEHSAGAPPAWDMVKALDWNEPSAEAQDRFVRGYGAIPDTKLFRRFEALMVLANQGQAARYGDWARAALL